MYRRPLRLNQCDVCWWPETDVKRPPGREIGERSRVFEEFPLDFGRETTPSHDDGRSQIFQNFKRD